MKSHIFEFVVGLGVIIVASWFILSVVSKYDKLSNIGETTKYVASFNDVSGISELVAKKSPWFKNISCKSGPDGTKLTLAVLKDCKKHLLKNGSIFFPILSLSNEARIFNFLNKKFKKYKIVAKHDWVMPKELMKYRKFLEKLNKKKIISFQNKFGLYIWNTKIIYGIPK